MLTRPGFDGYSPWQTLCLARPFRNNCKLTPCTSATADRVERLLLLRRHRAGACPPPHETGGAGGRGTRAGGPLPPALHAGVRRYGQGVEGPRRPVGPPGRGQIDPAAAARLGGGRGAFSS